MFNRILIQTFVIFALLAFGSFASTRVAADDEVQRLLRERLAVLAEIVEFRSAAYKAGSIDLKALLEAQQDVAHAKIELAPGPTERIAAIQNLIEDTKAIEELTKAEFEAARATKIDTLVAKSFRLKAEAELAREKALTK